MKTTNPKKTLIRSLFALSIIIGASAFVFNLKPDAEVKHEFPDYKEIFKQSLTDSGLVNKELKMTHMRLAPGQTDTVSHRHACELFIYVIEGELEYRRDKNPSVKFKKGEVLYEPPYSLHTLHKNPSKTKESKLLLVQVATKGKQTYLPEYSEKK